LITTLIPPSTFFEDTRAASPKFPCPFPPELRSDSPFGCHLSYSFLFGNSPPLEGQ
jgi:hypothetical protein